MRNNQGNKGEKERLEEESELTYIIPQPNKQARDAQHPEDDAQRLGHAQLGGAGLALEVEGEDDGDGNDGHVDGEAEVGQEGPLVGAVVAGVRRGVLEEERPQEGPGEEGVLAAADRGARQWCLSSLRACVRACTCGTSVMPRVGGGRVGE